MNLSQLTESRLLVPRLLSEWRDGAILELSHRLEDTGRIEDDNAFTHAVLDHESLVSAVFDGVAFPLARVRGVRELSFALGFSSRGICWGVGRTPVVSAVVLFAVPLNEGQRYLSLVVTFSRFLKDEMALIALRRCTRPEEMLGVLNHVGIIRTGPQLASATA